MGKGGWAEMTRRLTSLAVLALCLLALAGCRGRALPAGMEEQALLEAGREVLELVTAGDFQAVRAALRPDVAETVTEEDLRALAARQLEGAGDFRRVESSMTTGQSSDGEDYGVAVLYCRFAKDRVLFRLAFDPDLALIGLEIRKQ